jgi:hypothetical protein
MNTPTSFELKQIAETFFKEKGTFTIDNVLGLMKASFEAGYTKGSNVTKFQPSSIPPIKPLSIADLKFDPEWYKTPVTSNASSLEEALKKCQW